MKPKMGNITQKWDYLVPFTSDYTSKFSASNLSRLSGIPQQTVSRHLNLLVKKNIMSYSRDGKNKLFYFDLEKKSSEIMFNILENYKSLAFMVKQKLATVIGELMDFSESVIVFGSYASGIYTNESDLDLMIIGKTDKKKVRSLLRNHPMEINEHYVSYKEFKNQILSKDPLSKEIMKNHIIFGDISKMIKMLIL